MIFFVILVVLSYELGSLGMLAVERLPELIARTRAPAGKSKMKKKKRNTFLRGYTGCNVEEEGE